MSYYFCCQVNDDSPIKFWPPHDLPYDTRYKSMINKEQAYKLVTTADLPRAMMTPYGCHTNAVFLVSCTSLEDEEDVKADLNGVFPICLDSRTYTIQVIKEDSNLSFKTLSRLKMTLRNENEFHYKVNRRANSFGLVRQILVFRDVKGHLVGNCVLLQYYIDTRVAGDVESIDYRVPAHGNARDKQTSFHPIQKSCLDRINRSAEMPLCKSNQAYLQAMESSNDDVYGSKPRSKKQVIDHFSYGSVAKQNNPADEISYLLGFNEQLDRKFVLHHEDVPYDLWVLGTQRMCNDLQDLTGYLPVSADPTYGMGKFEVLIISYKHRFLETKSKNMSNCWERTTLLGPAAIQHDKSERTYDKIMHEVVAVTGLKKAKFGCTTDGEAALIKAIKGNCSKVVMLRCTRHFMANCKEFLSKQGVKGFQQDQLIDLVFGNKGLVDASDPDDLSEKLDGLKSKFSEIEQQGPSNSKAQGSSFYKYLKDREHEVLKKLICSRRLKANMPKDDNGIPLRSYTNLSETVNSVLTAKKKSLGLTKQDDVSKTVFIKDIYLPVVADQDEEICKALFGQSSKYRLTKEAMYLEIPAEKWFQLQDSQKKEVTAQFHKLTMEDITKKKSLNIPTAIKNVIANSKRHLSVDLQKEFPSIFYANDIKEKALQLLNNPTCIVSAPRQTLTTSQKEFLVAKKDDEHYKVMVTRQAQEVVKVTCDCLGFKHIALCSHSVAVAETEGVLLDLIQQVKQGSRSSLTYKRKAGTGRKISKARKKRVYRNAQGASSSRSQDATGLRNPFSEIWHNMQPLIVTRISDIPAAKRNCSVPKCRMAFTQGPLAVVPFDICLSHEEKWMYPRKENDTIVEWLPSPTMTTKYYCIRRECILDRFPYFTLDFLRVPEDMSMKSGHKTLFFEQLDVRV